MNNKDIAEQIRDWAYRLRHVHLLLGSEMRAFADRLEAEPANPTPADLVTSEEARRLLCEMCHEGFMPSCKDSGGEPCRYRGYGEEPLASAKLCHALWQRAKEGK